METVPGSSFGLLATYIRPLWRASLLLAVLLLGGVGLQLTHPLIVRQFIDTAAAGGAMRTLTLMALAFIVVALLAQGAIVAATYVAEQLGWHATNMLRADLMLHCLRLDMPFHHRYTPGELIERIDGDVTALSTMFSQIVVRVVGGLLLLIGISALMWREDPRIGLILTGFCGLALILLFRASTLAAPRLREERQATGELFGLLEERLAGLDDIRANGGGSYVMSRFHAANGTVYFKARGAQLLGSLTWVCTTGTVAVGSAVALGVGAWLYHSGAITLGTVYLVFQYTQMLRRPLREISNQMREFQRAGAGIGRTRSLLRERSALADGPGAALPTGPLSVTFEDVTFAYDGDQPVLERVNVHLQAGHVLGVLGRTGSGKTTLTRLLFRLYEPRSGVIRLGGVDIREPALAELRGRVGIVTQDVQIFEGTVRDNLTLFGGGVPDDTLIRLLDDLGLGGWLRGLPDGLDSVLPPGGGMSAGQAQLLAFGRVFLQDPGLVVLDEASSRLDPATEALIERAVDRLLEGRTAIIIAHRLGTVGRADEILVLEGRLVVEYGRRSDLAAAPDSRFAALLRHGMQEVLA